MPFSRLFASVLLAVSIINPAASWGCACGCGIFDVQTNGILPTRAGGVAFLEYDFMNQNEARNGALKASPDNNRDKEVRTHFFTAGARYMFGRRWGIDGQVPVWSRYFRTIDDAGNLSTFTNTALGDIRLQGIFSGFSPDMSSGMTFGVKLPTGDYKDRHFDRDTEIGSGSTDLLLGAYHMDRMPFEERWAWFADAQWDEPAFFFHGYKPGASLDAAVGSYWEDWQVGSVKIAPLGQVIASKRWSDRGPAGHPDASGYRRLVLSPGLEFGAGDWHLNVSAGFPVYQYMTGYQLAARQFYKTSVAYRF